jgi:maltose alpha-D-glucosyltransferase/alpha-amylase
MMMEVFLLQKAVYELGYELNNRPTWITIPLQEIVRLMNADSNSK